MHFLCEVRNDAIVYQRLEEAVQKFDMNILLNTSKTNGTSGTGLIIPRSLGRKVTYYEMGS